MVATMKQRIIRFLLTALSLAAGFVAIPAMLALQAPAASQRAPAPHSPQAPAASGSYALDWVAVGDIGGGASESPRYRLNATVGQAAASDSISAAFGACAGFECVRSLFAQMLPHTRRDTSAGW